MLQACQRKGRGMTLGFCQQVEKPASFGSCQHAIQATDGRKQPQVCSDVERFKNPVLMESQREETTSCPTIPLRAHNPAGPVQEACLSPLSSSSYLLSASRPLAIIRVPQQMGQPKAPWHQRPQMTQQPRLLQLRLPNNPTPKSGPNLTTHNLSTDCSRPTWGRLPFAVRGVSC
jgi:hypothetical protein